MGIVAATGCGGKAVGGVTTALSLTTEGVSVISLCSRTSDVGIATDSERSGTNEARRRSSRRDGVSGASAGMMGARVNVE